MMFKFDNKISIFFLFLLCVARTQTDLSKNNCPEDFNITEANETTGIGFSNLTSFYFSPFSSDERKTQVEKIIIESDYDAFNQLVMGQYIIAFIVIAAVFGITFFIVLACIVFEKSCPPCHSWRRDFAKRPYEKFEIRCVAIFAIIFAVGILATSIVAFTLVPALHEELQKTKCAIYTSVDVALNGDNNYWGGFTHIKNQVGNISKLLPSANTEVNEFFNDDKTLPDLMQTIRKTNFNIYSQKKDSKVITSDPVATAAVQEGDPLPKVDSHFIQTKLGPAQTPNTMTGQIQTALTNTKKLSDQADQIITSSFIIVKSSATIQSNTGNGQTLLTMYENQLNTYKSQIDTFSTNYFDPLFTWGIYVVQVVLGFILVSSLAVIIGAFSVQILNISECRYFLHCGWVVYGITYFGVVFVTFFTMPLASIGYTFCQYYNSSLTNQSQYNRIGEYYSQHVLNKLDVCLFDDGNVLKKFLIQDEMNTVARLFENIEIFKAMENVTNANYVSQTISQNKINQWKTIMQSYRDGITKDVNQLVTSSENPMVALSKMNSFTLRTDENADDTITRCSRDRWVYNQVDCQDDETKYVTPSTESQGITISMDFDTCIPFHTQLSTSSGGRWSLTDINKRYQQLKQTCNPAYEEIMNYATSITNYRDSRRNLFQSLVDSIDALKNEYNTFITELDSFRSSLASFSSTTTIRNMNNFVTNQIDGLLISSDCSPIGDSMKYFHNTFCVNAIGMSVQIGICMLVLMALMIGGLFTGCIFAQRVATVKRLHRIHDDKIMAVAQNSVHSSLHRDETLVKLQQFSKRDKSESESESSSSQED